MHARSSRWHGHEGKRVGAIVYLSHGGSGSTIGAAPAIASPKSTTATANARADVRQIPLSPSNLVRMLLLFCSHR